VRLLAKKTYEEVLYVKMDFGNDILTVFTIKNADADIEV